jgi:hypothetical protein
MSSLQAHALVQHGGQCRQLRFGQPHICCNANVRLELRLDTRDGRQRGKGGDFTALIIQNASTEQIAEKMAL